MKADEIAPVVAPMEAADRRETRQYLLLLLPALLALGVFFVYPLCGILLRSVYKNGYTLESYRQVARTSVYLMVIALTFRTAAVVTLIALLLGYPLGYVLATVRPRRRVGCALRVSHLVRRVIDPAVPGGRRGADAHGACLEQPAARGRPHDRGRQFVPHRGVLRSARRQRVAAQTDGRLMLHFTKQELAARRRAVCREMARQVSTACSSSDRKACTT